MIKTKKLTKTWLFFWFPDYNGWYCICILTKENPDIEHDTLNLKLLVELKQMVNQSVNK